MKTLRRYRLNYYRAKRNWEKAINRYFLEKNILISKENYHSIMFIEDPFNKGCLIYNPDIPLYLKYADKNLEDKSDEYNIKWLSKHKNRKKIYHKNSK